MYSVAQMSTLFGVRQQGFEATVLDDRSQPIPSSSNIVHLHMMTKVIMRVFGVLVLVLAFTFFTAACYAAYQAPKWSGKPRPKGSICDRRFVLFLRKSSAQSVNPNLVNLIQSVRLWHGHLDPVRIWFMSGHICGSGRMFVTPTVSNQCVCHTLTSKRGRS